MDRVENVNNLSITHSQTLENISVSTPEFGVEVKESFIMKEDMRTMNTRLKELGRLIDVQDDEFRTRTRHFSQRPMIMQPHVFFYPHHADH